MDKRSLVGYSRWGCKESDMTEQLTLFTFQESMRRTSPGGIVNENLPANAGDNSSIPDLGRFHMPGSD